MIEFKFKYFILSCILLFHFIDISVQQSSAYDDGSSGLDDPPPIWTCNGTDLTIRSYDGTCNNLKHNNWGAPNRVYDRGFFPAFYDDSFSGSPKINIDCRLLSNVLADNGQPPTFTGNPLGDDVLSSTRKSVFELFFGQLINHDLEDAALQSSTPGISIGDITNDFVFNTQPGNMWNPNGTQYMTLTLSLGRVLNSTLYPANKGNSYLDLSAVYGDNPDDAFGLRERTNGLMTLSKFVTDGGVYNAKLGKVTVENVAPSPQDSDVAPSLNVPAIPVEEAMVSGDYRASENVQLAMMHTLWIREHNFQAKKVLADNPKLAGNDEEIFQMARRITIAEYQHIVFEEFLPAAIGFKMPPYGGYDENIYADTTAVFAAAAFRYGHSQVRPYNIVDGCTEDPIVLHPDFQSPDTHPNRFFYVGRAIAVDPPPGSLLTHDAYDYTPARMIALASGSNGNGFDNIMVSMLRELAADFDLMITTPLRHMPAIIDLFATDIGRGRLAGLQPYNVYRAAYHPAGDLYSNPACDINAAEDSLECFSIITSNQTLAANLKYYYGKVNTIDAIIGMFAEDRQSPIFPLPPTIANIIKEEFVKKRYADRFWYEGDTFTAEEQALIKTVTMKQIIERNTNVINVQANAFKNPGVNDPMPVIGKCPKGPAKGIKAKGKDPAVAPANGAAPPAAPPAAPAKGAKKRSIKKF
ncbi:heme peroxidase [Glomus cerebriforme]|uniref:Heme peroxidase n=1 Tax=Glomus cerebriforme TaxID=658196 RepID=A0A397T412_9GLOM|nr:heme peroxidase [Glomus cerebriforme]